MSRPAPIEHSGKCSCVQADGSKRLFLTKVGRPCVCVAVTGGPRRDPHTLGGIMCRSPHVRRRLARRASTLVLSLGVVALGGPDARAAVTLGSDLSSASGL